MVSWDEMRILEKIAQLREKWATTANGAMRKVVEKQARALEIALEKLRRKK